MWEVVGSLKGILEWESYPCKNHQGKENSTDWLLSPKLHAHAFSDEWQFLWDLTATTTLLSFHTSFYHHSEELVHLVSIPRPWIIKTKMILGFLFYPALLLFPVVRKFQTQHTTGNLAEFIEVCFFVCFRPHMALIIKQFLTWSLISKIKNAVSLDTFHSQPISLYVPK